MPRPEEYGDIAVSSKPDLSVIEGTVTAVKFTGNDGYHVLLVEPADSQPKAMNRSATTEIVVTGHFYRVGKHDRIKAVGAWRQHHRFGLQFVTTSCEVLPPMTREGILGFLGSGMIKGIREGIARMLVDHFGMQTLEIIRNTPQRLTEAPGIGRDRAAKIRKSVVEYQEVEKIMVQLHSLGVASSLAIRIYKHFFNQSGDSAAAGLKALETIREEPYSLTKIWGIGFTTADAIALKQGISRSDPRRLRAGIIYLLDQATQDGHVCLPHDVLMANSQKILMGQISAGNWAAVKEAMARLHGEHAVRTACIDGIEYCYLPHLHAAEQGVAIKLGAIAAEAVPVVSEKKTRGLLTWVEKRLGIRFAEEQRNAVATALRGGLMVLTGGPGTGKTTITRAIVEVFSVRDKSILLASPTGRASKRLSEATGREAVTIHRLLEYDPRQHAFTRNEMNPLHAALIVVDEASMLDITLANHLLKAITPGTTVILVGDINQLPSVGPGRVLQDVIDSGVTSTVMLKEIFRQAQGSLIVRNAHLVNQGEMPLGQNPSGEPPDFFFLTEADQEKLRETIVGLVAARLPGKYGFDPSADIQVLCPMKKGPIGVHALNAALQEALNPSGPAEMRSYGITYRAGDKVMQIRNNYDKEVMNGEIGMVSGIDPEENVLTVDFPGIGSVGYEESELGELVLAYATSIHKSQGSEYPVVVVPVHNQHHIMLQRNLIYTAITRGKKLVVLVGTKQALAIAIKNNKVPERYSHLAALLREAAGTL